MRFSAAAGVLIIIIAIILLASIRFPSSEMVRWSCVDGQFLTLPEDPDGVFTELIGPMRSSANT